MEEETTTNENLESQVASLTTRLMTLEAKVSLLNTTQEHREKRLQEIQQFSENIATLQERKLAEIDESTKEQKKLLSEMRVRLQNLQNSRVNHKDILVRHENHVKKLIELVNEMSARQHELEMHNQWVEDAKARRFSSFGGKEKKIRPEDLYELQDVGGHGSRRRSSGRHHHHHRLVQSVPVDNERRRSSTRRF